MNHPMKGFMKSSELIYQGRIISLCQEDHAFPDGKDRNYEVIHHPGAVGVVPITAGGRLILVRQYRPATGEALLEIPAGLLVKGEDPRHRAVEELREEVGVEHSKDSLVQLAGCYMTPGISDEFFYLYAAFGAVASLEPSPEEDEILETTMLDWDEAWEAVGKQEIIDSKTLLGIALGYKEWVKRS